MNATLRRSGGCVPYLIVGTFPGFDYWPAKMKNRRFRSIDTAASEEVSVGWVTPADPTGESFELGDLLAGNDNCHWLRVRIDTKKLPKTALALALAAEEKARGRKLKARERRELKDDLHEKLLPRVLPTTVFVDLLVRDDKLLVLATAKSQREAITKLVAETFEVAPDRLGPGKLGAIAMPGSAIEQAQPTRWPVAKVARAKGPLVGATVSATGSDEFSEAVLDAAEELGAKVDRKGRGKKGGKPDVGQQQTFGFDTTHGFLGEEFLTWLWFRWDTDGGEFQLSGRTVGVMLDDVLAFAPAADGETQITLRQGMPTRAPEARTALRSGHRLAKARLIIADGSSTWNVTLDGENLSFAGAALPEDAEDCESAEDRTTDRAGNWFALQDIVAKLFSRFAGIRLGPDWLKSEARAMARWMSQ